MGEDGKRKEADKMIGYNKPIKEDKLTTDDVERVHKFGECWINKYSRFDRGSWEAALYLFAWGSSIEWNDLGREVPHGIEE